jgi:hypothetical protein
MRLDRTFAMVLSLATLLSAAAVSAAPQAAALRSQTDQTQRAIAEELRNSSKPLREKAAREQRPASEQSAPPEFTAAKPPEPAPSRK